jgi:DNA-binding MarR family transcriptional regulator
MADLTFALLEHCQVKREKMAESLGLTVAEFKFLLFMHEDDGIASSELARRMDLSNSRVTRIIDGLVKKKFTVRDISAADRRVMQIHLTPSGRKVRGELLRTYVKTHRDILDLLPKGADRSVIFAMEKLLDAMKSWVKL